MNRMSAYVLMLLFLFVYYQTAYGQANEAIQIYVEKKNSETVYIVNDKEKDLQQLRVFLGVAIQTYGRGEDIVIIAHENITFSDISNLRGLIRKIGFSNIKYYFHNNEKMIEILFKGPSISYPKK